MARDVYADRKLSHSVWNKAKQAPRSRTDALQATCVYDQSVRSGERAVHQLRSAKTDGVAAPCGHLRSILRRNGGESTRNDILSRSVDPTANLDEANTVGRRRLKSDQEGHTCALELLAVESDLGRVCRASET